MKLYTADFETVVEDNPLLQESTEVWAWGISELYDGTEHVEIDNSIESFFEYLLTLDKRIIVWFHNLKFDGSYLAYYIVNSLGLKQAYNHQDKEFEKPHKLRNNYYIPTISDMGIWYGLTIKYKGHLIEFRDSLKLLPFSIRDLGKAFNTKHRKLEMEYKGHLHAGEPITDHERHYLTNDVLVAKEALEAFLKTMGYEKKPPLTIGAAALKEFKKTLAPDEWKLYFPNLAEIKLDPCIWGYSNADEYIRHSYNGGWCYADYRYCGAVQGRSKRDDNKRIKVYDVNSLYPSMLHSCSGNRYPVGEPVFFKGSIKPHFNKSRYFFFRFRCNFELKEGYLPFIQIKNHPAYRRNDNLMSSFWDRFGDYDETIRPEMVLSETMFIMFKTCYKITDFELLDGCYFETEIGLFDGFINRFFEMKATATIEDNKVLRTIAKLFLNSLYGKFGTSPINAYKILERDGEELKYIDEKGEDKKPVYIPVASACTSYARRFTLGGALANQEYFTYSDTDSIHLCVDKNYVAQGITVHDTDLCAWKEESIYDNGLYIRQKTYMEFTGSDYDIKCCGLSDRGKTLFKLSANRRPYEELTEDEQRVMDSLTREEKEFLKKKRSYKDFKAGLSIPANLTPRNIKGGCVLINTNFTIK